jgi:uncharacterized membrane protein YbhN (UPF0104 family)
LDAGETSGVAAPDGQDDVRVTDHLETRVRIPADMIRSVVAAIEIGLLTGLALLASATATGVEFDFVGASEKLPTAVLHLIQLAGELALPILPLALAIRLAVRGQFRRLAEAIAAGGITVGVVAGVNKLLNLSPMSHLQSALHTHVTATSQAALDGYLAGLVAYVTIIGLRGYAHWRAAFLTGIGLYGLAELAQGRSTVFSFLITVLIGSAIGSGLRYAVGTIPGRPDAKAIAAALDIGSERIVTMSRVGNGGSEVRRYLASLTDGRILDVTVFDRDQQAADAFYRLYRRIRVRASVSRSAPLTLEGAIERQALLIYATEDAGVRTPRLHAVTKVGPDAGALATHHVTGTTMAAAGANTTDDQLREIWDTVLRLHEHRVTHRALTADRIMFAPPSPPDEHGSGLRPDASADPVVLLDPGNGDVAATDLQSRLDLAQLIAQTALLVGPERAAAMAIEKLPVKELPGLVPLLQPVALYRSTGSELRGRKSVLTELRKQLLEAAPGSEVPPVQVERIRPRSVITLVAAVFAAYLLATQLANVRFSQVFEHANVGWSFAALALSATTYVGATWSLSGFVLEKLNWVRTFLVQVAGSFVILVTPAAVGGVALNVRYLRRAKLTAVDAAATIGASQVTSLIVYVVLVLVSVAITGQSHAANALRPHTWEYIAVGALAALVLIVLAIPAGRRQVRQRLGSALGQVIPRLLDVAQQRWKLTEGIGGTLLISVAYILCLAASVRAVGVSTVPLASVAVVFLTGNAVGSIVPIPGGIGAIETAMTLGLTAAGMPGGSAITAVLLYRTFTFWLPAPAGWLALHHLQRTGAL